MANGAQSNGSMESLPSNESLVKRAISSQEQGIEACAGLVRGNPTPGDLRVTERPLVFTQCSPVALPSGGSTLPAPEPRTQGVDCFEHGESENMDCEHGATSPVNEEQSPELNLDSTVNQDPMTSHKFALEPSVKASQALRPNHSRPTFQSFNAQRVFTLNQGYASGQSSDEGQPAKLSYEPNENQEPMQLLMTNSIRSIESQRCEDAIIDETMRPSLLNVQKPSTSRQIPSDEDEIKPNNGRDLNGKSKKKTPRARVEDLDPASVFTCSYENCRKQFAKKYNLKIHERRHAGRLPFLCQRSDCGKRFMWNSSFMRHMKSHEPKSGGGRRRSRKRKRKPATEDEHEESKSDGDTMMSIEAITPTSSAVHLNGMKMIVDHTDRASIELMQAMSYMNSPSTNLDSLKYIHSDKATAKKELAEPRIFVPYCWTSVVNPILPLNGIPELPKLNKMTTTTSMQSDNQDSEEASIDDDEGGKNKSLPQGSTPDLLSQNGHASSMDITNSGFNVFLGETDDSVLQSCDFMEYLLLG